MNTQEHHQSASSLSNPSAFPFPRRAAASFNQVKETNTKLELGYHVVATDISGSPIDTDSDGWPDYWEDFNGNGSITLDSGETGWQSYNSINDLTGTPGLQVFTPLK